MRSVRLISLGMTIRPRSSTRLTIPVAVPGIFVGDSAPASSADRCHSLRSLLPPPAALPSLPRCFHISFSFSVGTPLLRCPRTPEDGCPYNNFTNYDASICNETGFSHEDGTQGNPAREVDICGKCVYNEGTETVQGDLSEMKRSTVAKLALLLTAMLWGSTFTIGKLAADVFSPAFMIAFRFLVASVALLPVAYPLRKQLDRKYWIDGFWMGFTLFLSYLLQVGGLALDTSPGKSAFLCTTYSVMVPFLHWFVTKKRPQLHHVVCVFLCLSGIGILSLSGGWGMSAGDILTVLSGVPCAMNMVITAVVSRERNVLLLTTIELWVVTLCACLCVPFGGLPAQYPLGAVGGIVYLGLIATALCLFLQSYGLKHAEPAIGGMLISLESVFGVIFSVMIYRERVTPRMIAGFAVIFLAIVLSQWDGKKAQ